MDGYYVIAIRVEDESPEDAAHPERLLNLVNTALKHAAVGVTAETVYQGKKIVSGPLSREMRQWTFSTREDARRVLDAMRQIIEKYEVVTIADFKDLVGAAGSYVDHKWGWKSLLGVMAQSVPNGFSLNLPAPELI